MSKKISIAFFGTPELTITILDSLKESGLTPDLIVTNKDKPKGRKLIMTPPLPKLWAIQNNIECFQPDKIDDSFTADLKSRNFDIFVVVAYGKILPEKLINTPKYGTINVHYSILPKYRGATPVESAILNGDTKTGVCIQKMQFKLDTGPILAIEEVNIPDGITASELRNILNQKAKVMLPNIIREYIAGKITPKPQDEKLASHSKKIKKEDGLINLSDDAKSNFQKIRAYSAWPKAYFIDENKKRVVINDASLENGILVIRKVTPESKREMSWEEYSRGRKAIQ